ncbi:hypothetical protein [Streptomyces sp. TRM49041]|uniref:hypothetical protein n=1 Tax=Streptomyces sp. TRM49041 TaxID=2603216 RepID=UPI0011EE1A4E|nr:hypothetical protein [Streptomyces sp. TRM49041]
MPGPGSEKYDIHRARLREEAEDRGVSDQRTNEEADAEPRERPEWRSRGPRAERGRGPRARTPRRVRPGG